LSDIALILLLLIRFLFMLMRTLHVPLAWLWRTPLLLQSLRLLYLVPVKLPILIDDFLCFDVVVEDMLAEQFLEIKRSVQRLAVGMGNYW